MRIKGTLGLGQLALAACLAGLPFCGLDGLGQPATILGLRAEFTL
ncbi:MAG: hypothetical protein RI897_4480 [Verrucomicrobiota bacterium]|jgi:hypothetical protein